LRKVREGVRANLLAGVTPSEAAIVDAAARGVEVVRSHRCDIDALRGAAAVLLSELSVPLLNLKVTERSRAIADLSMTMARLVPLERQPSGKAVFPGATRPGFAESSGAVRARDDRDRGCRVAARTVDECEATISSEEEADADVAAGLPAVLVVDRVDLPVAVGRPARRLDRGDEAVERHVRVHDGVVGHAVVVLDLLEADDVRRTEVVHDHPGEGVVLRVGLVPGEIFDVERRDRDLVRAGGDRRLADGQAGRADHRLRA
jgi:hypothetical protein